MEQKTLMSTSAKPSSPKTPKSSKGRLEAVSDVSFKSAKVHYNSEKPVQLQALPYAQSNGGVVQCLMSQQQFVTATTPVLGRRGVHNGVHYNIIEQDLLNYHNNQVNSIAAITNLRDLLIHIHDWAIDRPESSRHKIRYKLHEEVVDELLQIKAAQPARSVQIDNILRDDDFAYINADIAAIPEADPTFDDLKLLLQDVYALRELNFRYSENERASSTFVHGLPQIDIAKRGMSGLNIHINDSIPAYSSQYQAYRKAQVVHEITHKLTERQNIQGIMNNGYQYFNAALPVPLTLPDPSGATLANYPNPVRLNDRHIMEVINKIKVSSDDFFRVHAILFNGTDCLKADKYYQNPNSGESIRIKNKFDSSAQYLFGLTATQNNISDATELPTVVNQLYYIIYQNKNLFKNIFWASPSFQKLKQLSHYFRTRNTQLADYGLDAAYTGTDADRAAIHSVTDRLP